MNVSKFRILPMTLAVGVALTGCLSSSDDDTKSVSVSGVVADGYLSNALVCLDINLNKQCDSNEPQATTDSEGKYNFTAAENAVSNYPVISVITSATKDADDPTRVLKDYVLSAPAGKPEFISPMTTMVQTEIESNPGLSVEAAETSVKFNLGYGAASTVSLFKDYVAAKADATDLDKEEYARIHKIAQVTARTLEENHSAILAAAEEVGRNPEDIIDELVRLVVKEVIANLDSITTAVDDAGDNFDPGTATETTAIEVDTSNIEEDIAAEEAVSTAKSIDIAALLKAGLNWIESEFMNKVSDSEYQTTKITLDTNNQIAFSGEYWDWDSSSWITAAFEDDEPRNCQYLTASGLVTVTCDGTESIVDNGDGTATMSVKDEAGHVIRQELIKGVEIPLEGKRIRGTLDDEGWYKAIPGNAVFGTGAKGYRWNFTTVGNTYEMAYHEAETGSTCANDGFLNLTTTNCVAARTTNGALAAPTSLADLADGSTEIKVGPRLGVTFTLDDTDPSKGTTSFTVEGDALTEIQGTFKIETPFSDGSEILSFETPRALRGELQSDDWAKLFLVSDGEYVRFGGIRPNGVSDTDDDFTYNSAALTDIKECFMGGTETVPCPVELKIRDPLLVAEGETVPVTFDTSKSMVPFNLDVAGTTMQVSTDDSTMRWTFTLNTDKTATFFSATNSTVQNLTWTITGNGYLKLERTINSGTDTETWLFTTLSDGTLHLNRKRTDGLKNFGGFVTLLQ